jgi:chromosome segregation ATPase
MTDSSLREESSLRHASKQTIPTATPVRSSKLLTRLTDSSRKLDQFEKKQIDQLSAKLETQRKEFEKQQSEFHAAVKLKLEYRAKLIETNKSFSSGVVKLVESIPNAPADLLQKQNSLIAQLERMHQTCLDPRELKKRIKELDAELASLKKNPTKPISPQQPEDENRIAESVRTMKIMKSQCLGIEEYLRNGVKFERDEAKAEIRRLQREESSLLKDLMNIKEAVASFSTNHARSQKYLDGFRLLTNACENLEECAQQKIRSIEEVKEKHANELERLRNIRQSSEQIEEEIRKCREVVMFESTLPATRH